MLEFDIPESINWNNDTVFPPTNRDGNKPRITRNKLHTTMEIAVYPTYRENKEGGGNLWINCRQKWNPGYIQPKQ